MTMPQADRLGAAARDASDAANAVLASPWAPRLDRGLRGAVDAKATAASRAMDAEYVRTHAGGGWHRLFDGNHDLLGAWRAVRGALPEAGLPALLGTYATELWKDLATPYGLPVVTWNRTGFDVLAGLLHQLFGIAPGWLRDMASVTATEAAGALLAIVALVLARPGRHPERHWGLCGSIGVAAVAGANPLLLFLWLGLLLRLLRPAAMPGWAGGMAMLGGAVVSATGIVTLLAFGTAGLLLALPAMLLARRGLRWATEAPRRAIP